jgi:adenine-specific DNA-methyltransferase
MGVVGRLPKTGKPVNIPDRGWRWKEETFHDAANYSSGKYNSIIELHDGTFLCGRIWFDKDENKQPSSINYLDEVEKFLLRSIISLKSNGGIEVEKLFEGKSYFSYPKPTSLLKTLIKSFELESGDIVLDFFAGSGTLGHAILELNEEDGVQRKFICVQLPEKTEEDSEAFKSGYKSIAEIAEARIKKVIEKISQERNGKIPFETLQKLNFRKYSLSSSNFKIWRGDILDNEEELKKQMSLFVTPQKANSQTENILWELLIKSGVPLTEKIEIKTLPDSATIYHTVDKKFAFVLDKYTQEVQTEVLKLKPRTVICLDSLFHNEDKVKTNAQLKFEDNDITFKTV